MKILAVDDDDFILELLTTFASKAGFPDVAIASSGEEALHMIAERDDPFDCMFFDISMPGMDGIELCSLVRSRPAYGKTPIIMLTAMTDKEFIDRAFQAGATDYVNKPIDIVELNARLRMSEELIAARRMKPTGTEPTVGTQADGSTRHLFALSDEVQIDGIPNLIEQAALKNYLAQLSRAGLAASQVLAVKIDRVEMIHEKATPPEFRYALSETAEAIVTIFSPHGYMMAYSGDGAFLVVSNRASLLPAEMLEADIQDLLDERNCEYDDGSPLDIEVSIGNPIRPSIDLTQRTPEIFDRAISRANVRVQKKLNAPRPLNIRPIGG